MSRRARLDAMLAEAWNDTVGRPPQLIEEEGRRVAVHSLGEVKSSIQAATGLDADQVKAAIGLGPDHAEPAPTVAAARPAQVPSPARTAAAVPTSGGRQNPAHSPEVRLWAVSNGWEVPPGRLPGAIVLAYQAARAGMR